VSHNDIETQKIRFNKDTSTTEAVKAWRNREVCIAEKESDIPYLYNQQKSKYKSIIAYPIFENNDCAKQVIGVISVTSSRNAFFIMQDIDRHKNYIEQFALRLVFEYCKLQSNNNANPA
jgi:putative methionine-R-sulfoxide reductase with GAF domain